jgi:integrase
MKITYEIRFWDIKVLKNGKRRYGIRWVTGPKRHSRYYETKALANSRRSELMQAARRGEAFDIESGLPVSELKRRDDVSFLEFAQSYMDMKWPTAAATTRGSLVEALATAGAVFVRGAPGRPDIRELRQALTARILPPTTRHHDLQHDEQRTVDWLRRQSRPLADLTEPAAVRDVLDALAAKLDGTPVAATVYRRKRAVLFNLFSYAVERQLLTDNPLARVTRATPKMIDQIDPRVVANPSQIRELLTAVTYVGTRNRDRGAHLHAFFATVYYAAARPAEVLALRETDCKLPDTGWGELALGESRPAAGKRWTDSGEVHDRRGLKHRGVKDVRIVPIPPILVSILTNHLKTYGTAPDGRLFRSPNGSVVGASTYYRIWAKARTYALSPAQVSSPLAGRPYDLRHAAVSLWLNGGVPATEIAERAGHSVEVLLRVYAKCIDGQRDTINKTIDGLLG